MRRFDLGLILAAVAGSASAQTPTMPAAVKWGVTCAVRPSQIVQVAAPVNGIIASVAVRPGSVVAVGDVLATFDTQIAATDLALAEARAADASALDVAERRLAGLSTRVERLESARASQAIAQAEYDAAVLERDLAAGEVLRVKAEREQARLEALRARIVVEKSVVRSPVAGTVAEGLIDPGETPGTDQPIATITVTDPLRIEAYVPAATLGEFVNRKTHEAVIAGKAQDVTLDYVSAMADLSSGTISVFFTLRDPSVLPGLDCVFPSLPPVLGD